MSTKSIIMFAVKSTRDTHGDFEIYSGYIHSQTKHAWKFMLTGSKAGQHKHFNKSKWVLFGNLLGARAHLKSLLEDELRELADRVLALQSKIDGLSDEPVNVKIWPPEESIRVIDKSSSVDA